jgi:hypothetical protein
MNEECLEFRGSYEFFIKNRHVVVIISNARLKILMPNLLI